MASRIDWTYYGAENTQNVHLTDTWKSCYYWIQSFPRYSGMDIEHNDDLNLTAAPWGLPLCSWTQLNYNFFFANNGSLKYSKYENTKKNMPLFTMYAAQTGDTAYTTGDTNTVEDNQARALYAKSRIVGQTKGYASGNNFYIDSTATCDNGYHLNVNSNRYTVKPLNNTTTTYLDYQKFRIIIGDCKFLDISRSGGNWKEHTVNAKDLDTYEYTGQTINDEDLVMISALTHPAFQNEATPYTAANSFYPFFGTQVAIPDELKNIYYDSTAENWIQTGRGLLHLGSINGRYYDLISNMDNYPSGRSSSFPYKRITYMWGNHGSKRQVFSDVSYHWEIKAGVVVNNEWYDLSDGSYLPANNNYFQRFAYMVIDAHNYETKYQAFLAAVMHEVAFLGFPFIYDDSLRYQLIGSDGVYIPKFDYEHMMTTGDYINSSETAAQSELNYSWGDIFDDSVPEYDPTYDPPEPEPEQGDTGDITNKTKNRFTNAGGLSQWVVSQSTLLSIQSYLNGTYLPTIDDLDADFKGTNPQDYIVSVQKYPFDIPYQGTQGTIYVGNQSTGQSGYKLFADFGGIGVLPINSLSTFDFGSIAIPNYYNDFRDYLSKILLFMPFVGTVELDPRLYIGKTVGLLYTIDYNTGSVSAEIKRDGLTMETKTNTISITIPFMAANMGAYQNQLAQLAYSKEMTKLKGVQTALTTGFQIGSAAQGAAASGNAPGLGQLSAIASGAMQLAQNATTLDQIDYQIEHTAPSVGTISTAAAANAFFMDPRARLVIIRPYMEKDFNPSEYSHIIGNACLKTGLLSDFSGFTVAASAILDNIVTTRSLNPLAASEQEKQLLKKQLQSGIYL